MKNKKIILCLIAFAFVIILSLTYKVYKINSTTFDKNKWASYPCKRWKILSSFFEEYSIIGLSKTEIIELLGEEDTCLYKNTIMYFISDGLGAPEFLVIYFDDNDIAYKHERYIE